MRIWEQFREWSDQCWFPGNNRHNPSRPQHLHNRFKLPRFPRLPRTRWWLQNCWWCHSAGQFYSLGCAFARQNLQRLGWPVRWFNSLRALGRHCRALLPRHSSKIPIFRSFFYFWFQEVTGKFGEHNKFQYDHANEFSLTTDNIFIHPKYYDASDDGTRMNYDVCLLKFEEDILATAPNSDSVKPICLPTEDVTHGDACWVAGWGITSYGGYGAIELQSVGVSIMDHNYCMDKSYSIDPQEGNNCELTSDNIILTRRRYNHVIKKVRNYTFWDELF